MRKIKEHKRSRSGPSVLLGLIIGLIVSLFVMLRQEDERSRKTASQRPSEEKPEPQAGSVREDILPQTGRSEAAGFQMETETEQVETETRQMASEPEFMEAPAAVDREDLKIVEGIGQKTEELLHEHGILNLEQLAATDVETLQEILNDAGFNLAVPDTWPEQARLAAEGKTEELQDMKERIRRGRIEGE